VRIYMTAALAAGLIAAASTSALAQATFSGSETPRWHLAANGLFLPGASSFTDDFEFTEFVEPGTIETSFDTKSAFGFDGSLGVRIWRNVGIGAGVSTFSPASREDGGGEVTARIPHPFHFKQHREVTGDAGLRRKETAIHLDVLYFVPVRDNLQVILAAGPTFFQAEQSFVNDVLYDQTYPFDEATFRGVDRDNESASGTGFNASLDLAWRFSRSFGLGGLVRYTRAQLPFTPGERTVTVDVGGVQAGLGVRIIF
jgi:hypothetical protein